MTIGFSTARLLHQKSQKFPTADLVLLLSDFFCNMSCHVGSFLTMQEGSCKDMVSSLQHMLPVWMAACQSCDNMWIAACLSYDNMVSQCGWLPVSHCTADLEVSKFSG